MTTITAQDLADLKADIETIDEVVESNLDTAITKDAKTINTLTGQLKLLGYQPPVAYAGAISFTANDGTKTIERLGIIYAPLPSALPFTTTGTWAADDELKFFLVQYTQSGDIRQFGGVDDWNGATGTDNKPAFDTIYAQAVGTIHLPKTPGGTGVYLYDGINTDTDAAGVTITADPGVSIHMSSSTQSPMRVKNLVIDREVKSRDGILLHNQYMGPNAYLRPSEQSRMASAAVGEVHTPNTIDLLNTRDWTLANLTSSLVSSAHPGGGSSSEFTFWGAVPAGSWVFSTTAMAVGDHALAYALDVDNPAIIVETDTGWFLVYNPQSTSDLLTTERHSAANTTRNFDEVVLEQDSYQFHRASVGIILYSTQSFGVTVNGVLLRRFETQGNIISAGWGAGNEGSASALTIARAIYFTNKKTVGIKPLKVVAVGDEISSEDTPPSQYQYMSNYLAGACGGQILTLTNIAVSGDTSALQLTALQGTDISDYDYCCIQIGQNDIRLGLGTVVFTDNVILMLDYCDSNFVTPIVSVPTHYYSVAEAQVYGQDGVVTVGTGNVGLWVTALLRALADRGGVFVNISSSEGMGAIIPSLLSTDLDPMVSDNILPTALGQMEIGYGFAKSIIGHATGKNAEGSAITSPADWWVGALGTTDTPFYTTSNGEIEFSFFLSRDAVTINNGDIIGNLPDRFFPDKDTYVSSVNTTGTQDTPTALPSAQLLFKADGTVKAYNIDPACIFFSVTARYKLI